MSQIVRKMIAMLLAFAMLLPVTSCMPGEAPELIIPTASPEAEPADASTAEPVVGASTAEPTDAPTSKPTAEPTEEPTPDPDPYPAVEQREIGFYGMPVEPYYDYTCATYVYGEFADVTEEAAKQLTHLFAAFALFRNGALTVIEMDSLERLNLLRKVNPNLKICLSIGGWGADGFSQAAATEAGRIKLARQIRTILVKYGLDGVDIDWEYPALGVAEIATDMADKENFTLLLREIRKALDTVHAYDGGEMSLTIAAGAFQNYWERSIEIEEVTELVDFFNLMTYDFVSGWGSLTGHNSNLYLPAIQEDIYQQSIDKAVNMVIGYGVPAEKIVVGASAYGMTYTGVTSTVNNGLCQQASGIGTFGPYYTEIVSKIGTDGFVRYFDEAAKAPYLYNGDTFITYDDEESVGYKCEYIKEKKLHGIMYWAYNYDRHNVLLSKMSDVLGTHFPE